MTEPLNIPYVTCTCGKDFNSIDDWTFHVCTEHFGVEIFPKQKSCELLNRVYKKIEASSASSN